MDERALIARLRAATLGDEAACDLLDDATRLAPVEEAAEYIVSTDAIAAGVHFLDDCPPAAVADKLARVNLSDLAACAARPRGLWVAAVFDARKGPAWAQAFADGLAASARAFGVPVLGGDLVEHAGPATFTATALGTAPRARRARRDGAREGDDLWVSGAIGDAAAGLAVLRGEATGLEDAARARLVARYRAPEPRLALGYALGGVVSAMADASDGLSGAASAIACASRLRAAIDWARVPVSPEAAQVGLALEALAASDDYELVFAAPPEARADVLAAGQASGVPVSRVGVFRKGVFPRYGK